MSSSSPFTDDSLADAALAARLFPGGGEMGERIRRFNWADTLLGPVHTWPQSLCTAVSVMLGSQFPMMVHWGPELVHFYNDGYATILQDKHPGALGQPAKPWWGEMWPFLLTIFTPVQAGQTTYFENKLVLPHRQGFIEETYFTFSHSPIHDETGAVGGIFVTALETTATVLQQRRLALLSHLTANTTLSSVPAEAAQHVIAALATNPHDIPFALLYTHEPQASHATLGGWFGLPAGEPVAPALVPMSAPSELGWPLAAVLQQSSPLLVDLSEQRFGPWPAGDWPVPPTQALLVPLHNGGSITHPATVLVLGLSSRLPLDEAYQTFLTLAADYAGRALARASAVHETIRLNQVLRNMNASLDSFVHIVAHDLKAPATNLSSLLEVYHEENPGPTRDHVMQLVEQEIHRLASTVQGLMQVLHTQHDEKPPVRAAVALQDAFMVVEAAVAELLQEEEGMLTANFQAAPTVRFPQIYLESIMKNLIHNALKYRAPERAPVIHVQSHRQENAVVLTVSDNGQGIDLLRDGKRLFQPFTRLTAEGEGAGLGLHMIRTLVQQRGGTVDVASVPGVGTTFTVVLVEDSVPLPV